MQDVSVQLYTAADLWALSHRPEYAGKRLELREGVLIEMSPAGGLHGQIASRLDRLIGAFVEARRLGAVTAAKTGYVLCAHPEGRDTVRAPDVGFVAAGRLPEGMPDGYIPFAPDLAVEVISPNDDAEAVQQKVLDYLRCGTRQVWVVYPRARSVVVHTPEGSAQTFGADDTLDGGTVLPGLRIPLRDVFSPGDRTP